MTKNSNELLTILGDRSLTFAEKLRAARELVPDEERKHLEGKGRSDSRVTDYARYFRSMKGVSYLDVGCSEGTITNGMARALDAKVAKACDIDPRAGKKLDPSIEFRVSNVGTLPYPPKSFDVVTLTMVAHHFGSLEDEEAMLREISRVTKTSVLVREHDVTNVGPFRDFLDSIHALYSCVFGDETTVKEFINSYHHEDYAHYRTVEEWKSLFERVGLELRGVFRKGDYVKSVVMEFEVWSPPFLIAKSQMDKTAFKNLVGTQSQIDRYFSVTKPFSGKEYGIWSVYTVKTAETHINYRKAGMKPVFIDKLSPKEAEKLNVEVLYTETDENYIQNKNTWKIKAKFQNHVDRSSISDIIEKDRLPLIIGDIAPRCWSFSEFRQEPDKFYIAKPVGVGASCNAGISVFSTQKEYEVAKRRIASDKRWRGIVCEYYHNPFLYQNKKFHVRFHIIVRTWAPTVCFRLGEIFLAQKPYVEYETDLKSQTSHMDDSPVLIFPDDLSLEGYSGHIVEGLKSKAYLTLLKTIERIDEKIKAKPYQGVLQAWHVLAVDLMFYFPRAGIFENLEAVVLEINDKPAFNNNEKNLDLYLERLGIAYEEWEYKVTIGDLISRGLF